MSRQTLLQYDVYSFSLKKSKIRACSCCKTLLLLLVGWVSKNNISTTSNSRQSVFFALSRRLAAHRFTIFISSLLHHASSTNKIGHLKVRSRGQRFLPGIKYCTYYRYKIKIHSKLAVNSKILWKLIVRYIVASCVILRSRVFRVVGPH